MPSPIKNVVLGVVVAMVVLASVVAPSTTPDRVRAASTTESSSFLPVGPVRLLDTRTGGAPVPPSGSMIVVPVRGVAGIPTDAVAATVSVAATETVGPGFVTLWGDGDRPSTSVLNMDAAGQTRSNFAIVPIGADGSIRAVAQGGAHLILDVTGVFRPASTATGGRLVSLAPIRLLDTRVTADPVRPGEQRTVSLVAAGVPSDALAAVVSVTGIGQAGWWAAWQSNSAWPGTSVVTVATTGGAATATAVVRLTAGTMLVSSNVGGDVVIDVSGYFTGASAADSSDGLFVPIRPTRLLDTRDVPGPVGLVVGGTSVAPSTYPFDRLSASSVAVNITAVGPVGQGFLTAYPASTQRPVVATASVGQGQLLATGSIVGTSGDGFSVYSMVSTQLVVDLSGYFLGTPVPAVAQPAPFQLLFATADGAVWRWNACAPIPVSVNYDRAPAGAAEAVAAALGQLRLATGLPFMVGPATSSHSAGATPSSPGVLIHWMTALADPALAGNTLGWGGAKGVSTSAGLALFSGEVRLKAGVDYATIDGDGLLDLLLHELGHVAGLGHVDTPTQIMYPSLSHLLGRYQLGDLAGLTVVGAPPPVGGIGGCSANQTQRVAVLGSISPMMVAAEPGL